MEKRTREKVQDEGATGSLLVNQFPKVGGIVVRQTGDLHGIQPPDHGAQVGPDALQRLRLLLVLLRHLPPLQAGVTVTHGAVG